MALLDNEKGEALYFLGYPARTLVSGSMDFSRRVQERFENLPDHFEARIKKILGRIRAVEDKLDEATARYAVTEIEGTKVNAQEATLLKAERKRLVLQLSNLLDLPALNSSSACVGVVS